MTDTIEVPFTITKPLLKELICYIRRFPFFDNKILPIFIFVYLAYAGYLAVQDIQFLIKDCALHWEFLPALSQLNIFFFALILFLVFFFPRLQYNVWKRIFLNSTYCIIFKFDAKQVLIENRHESGVHTSQCEFSFFNDVVVSRNFLYLRSNKKLNTIIIFLKKDAITYADFQRLQEAIPCLQGLSVDPQQFKQEPDTHES